jgi:pyruvate kinase
MKTYATLGPACREVNILVDMLRAGLTGFRLDLTRQALSECGAWRELLRRAAEETGTAPELLLDLRGREVYTGDLETPLPLKAGDSVSLGTDGIPLAPDVVQLLRPGMTIELNDGALALEVTAAGTDTVPARCRRSGTAESRMPVVLPGVEPERPAVSEKDLQDLSQAADFGATGIMFPFVRRRGDVEAIRRAMAACGAAHLTLLPKVESRAGLASLPEWMDLADVVIIARKDLGNDLSLWRLPRAQKQIAALCRQRKKPFLVVAQLLHSMIRQPSPTRAEVLDIYNACLDGAEALMLTGETAQGHYPVESVAWLRRVAREGEADRQASISRP